MRELPWIYIARQRSRLTIFPIEQVQSLLEDIKDVRWDKVEKGLKTLSGRTHAVKVTILLLDFLHTWWCDHAYLILVCLSKHHCDSRAATTLIAFIFDHAHSYLFVWMRFGKPFLELIYEGCRCLQLKNLSAMEVNRMRTFTVRALQSFFKHDNDDMMKQTPTDSDSQSTPTSSDRLPRVCSQDFFTRSFDFTFYLCMWCLDCWRYSTSQACKIRKTVWNGCCHLWRWVSRIRAGFVE